MYTIRKLIYLFFFLFSEISFGQSINIPINIQAALLTKVLKFNTNISAKNPAKIIIIYDKKCKLLSDKLAQELKSTFDVTSLYLSTDLMVPPCDILYLLPGQGNLKNQLKINKVLTVTGVSKYVENGIASLGFGLENDKPKILINITTLKTEEQNFSTDILRISKVYK